MGIKSFIGGGLIMGSVLAGGSVAEAQGPVNVAEGQVPVGQPTAIQIPTDQDGHMFNNCSIEVDSQWNLSDGNYIVESIELNDEIKVTIILETGTSDSEKQKYLDDTRIMLEELVFNWKVDGHQILEYYPGMLEVIVNTPIVIRKADWIFDDSSSANYCVLPGGSTKRVVVINSKTIERQNVFSLSSLFEEEEHTYIRQITDTIYEDLITRKASELGAERNRIRIEGRSYINELMLHARRTAITTFPNEFSDQMHLDTLEGGTVLSRSVLESLTNSGNRIVYEKNGELEATWLIEGREENPYSSGSSIGAMFAEQNQNMTTRGVVLRLTQIEIEAHKLVANNPDITNKEILEFVINQMDILYSPEEFLKAYLNTLRIYGQSEIVGTNESNWQFNTELVFDSRTLSPLLLPVRSGQEFIPTSSGWVGIDDDNNGSGRQKLIKVIAGEKYIVDYYRYAIFYPEYMSSEETTTVRFLTGAEQMQTLPQLSNIGISDERFIQTLISNEDNNLARIIYSDGGFVVRADELEQLDVESIGFFIDLYAIKIYNYGGEEFLVFSLERIDEFSNKFGIKPVAYFESNGLVVGSDVNNLAEYLKPTLSVSEIENFNNLGHWSSDQLPFHSSVNNLSSLQGLIAAQKEYITQSVADYCWVYLKELDTTQGGDISFNLYLDLGGVYRVYKYSKDSNGNTLEEVAYSGNNIYQLYGTIFQGKTINIQSITFQNSESRVAYVHPDPRSDSGWSVNYIIPNGVVPKEDNSSWEQTIIDVASSIDLARINMISTQTPRLRSVTPDEVMQIIEKSNELIGPNSNLRINTSFIIDGRNFFSNGLGTFIDGQPITFEDLYSLLETQESIELQTTQFTVTKEDPAYKNIIGEHSGIFANYLKEGIGNISIVIDPGGSIVALSINSSNLENRNFVSYNKYSGWQYNEFNENMNMISTSIYFPISQTIPTPYDSQMYNTGLES